MAKKQVTINEPGVQDVGSLQVRWQNGAPTMVQGSIQVEAEDEHTSYPGNFELNTRNLTPEVQAALETLAQAGLAQYKAKHGF